MAESAWSIGAYVGSSPFSLAPPPKVRNPVLTAGCVTDMQVNIVAHPFMVIEASTFHLFFTAKMDDGTHHAVSGIGSAHSTDGLAWQYDRIVLKEPYVLAHPQVVGWQGQYYMIPEAHTETGLRLYRATEFPNRWSYECELLSDGGPFISPSLIRHGGMWWMFTCRPGNATLRLFHAPDLKGPWREHPASPVVADNPHTARPGGPPFVVEGRLYRTGQDCHPTYGRQLFAFRVTELSPTAYKEEMVERPLIAATGSGWNSDAMHHADLHQLGPNRWLAPVDACGAIEPR